MLKLATFDLTHLSTTLDWMQDDQLKHDFMFDKIVTKESHSEWFNKTIEDDSQKIWAILDDEKHVGNIGLKNIDLKNNKAEIWIYVGLQSHRGKHIGTRSCISLFELLEFKSLNLHKVYSHVASWNQTSKKMFLNVGFRHEATLIDEILFKGQYVTIDRFGKILV